MIDLTKIYYFIFGALTIAGGIMGFVKKSSYVSLVAGGLSGVLLFIAALWLKDKPQNGLILGAVVSIALAGKFLPKFLKNHDWMPGGTMSVLSVIAIIVTLLAFATKK